MKLSRAYWKTLRESPADAEIISHELLMRAGFLHKSAAGLYSYLPFAVKTIQKIEKIIREELDKIDSQEITMSIVTPGELWKESGRWDSQEGLMLRFEDRMGRDVCISPTNEEAVTDIFRKSVSSYKELPVSLYQINTKFRDELRPRYGLMRGREFVMKDAYTFSLDKECLDRVYNDFYKAYSAIFSRMGLEFITVEADGGAMADGDAKTHEFQVIADSGEDLVIEAKEINYAANIEKAITFRPELDFTSKSELTDVETKAMASCEDVAKFLNIPVYQTLKTLIYTATYGKKAVNYMVMILGDDSVNEVKLKNFLKADHITHANDNALMSLGLPKGYMSPIGFDEKISVIFDQAISKDHSYVVGANKDQFHTKGFCISRDVSKFKTADLRLAKEGDLAHDKKTPVKFRKGIEVGHIFQLGDKYTKSMNATVLDENGKKIIPLMGCYGIGVTRTMAAAVEQSHDENGIIWPASIAPFHVYLVAIAKSDEAMKKAEEIYKMLKENNIEVVFDDRKGGPGPKFKDADLLGLPIRVTFGERDFNESGELEVKVRKTGEQFKIKTENLVSQIKEKLKEL